MDTLISIETLCGDKLTGQSGLAQHTPSSEKHQGHHCVYGLISTATQLALLFLGFLFTVTSADLQLVSWVLCKRGREGKRDEGSGDPKKEAAIPRALSHYIHIYTFTVRNMSSIRRTSYL